MKTIYIVAIAISILFIFGCSETVEPVKIGFIGPLTGDISPLAKSQVNSMTMAAEEINSNGGIKNKPVKLIFEDGQCNGQKAATAAQKLINVDKVDVIVSFCSPETLAIAPMAESTKTLIISGTSTNPSIKYSGDYIFRIVPSDDKQGKEGAELMEQYDNVAILNVNNDWGVGLKQVFKENFKNNIIATETFEMDSKDMKTQLLKIKEQNPDAIYMPCYEKQATIILKQMQEIGLNVPAYTADGAMGDSLIGIVEDTGIELYVTIPGVPESAKLQEYATNYKTRFNEEYGAYGPEGYDVVYVAETALKNSETSEEAKDFLYTMGTFEGASGKFEFDSFGEVEKPYDIFVVEGGKFVKI